MNNMFKSCASDRVIDFEWFSVLFWLGNCHHRTPSVRLSLLSSRRADSYRKPLQPKNIPTTFLPPPSERWKFYSSCRPLSTTIKRTESPKKFWNLLSMREVFVFFVSVCLIVVDSNTVRFFCFVFCLLLLMMPMRISMESVAVVIAYVFVWLSIRSRNGSIEFKTLLSYYGLVELVSRVINRI